MQTTGFSRIFQSRLGHGTARPLRYAYFTIAGLLIFVLPYHVPMRHVAYSVSYDFGFNNRIAVLGALFSIAIAPFMLGRDAERTPMAAAPRDEPPLSKSPLFVMAALHTAGIAFYFLVTLVEPSMPDGSYFLSHAINMAHGLRPYVDFEYAYGPGLIYQTHWLTSAGLSVHSAYFVFYLAISFVGLYIAWSFAALLPIRNSLKLVAFLMICGVSIVSLSTVGVSYTIVRFVTPLWVLGKLNEAYLRRRPVWQQALMACIGIVLVDLISPEIGTVLAVTAAAFFGFTCLRSPERRAQRAISMLACVGTHFILFYVVMPPEFRSSMLAFADGGNNLPVVPSILNILYLFCFLYCVKRHIPPLIQQSLIFPLIVVFALGSMTGALTHADPGHIVWDGLGVFVLAVIADGSKPNISRRVLAIAPVLLFALANPYRPTKFQILLAEQGASASLSGALEKIPILHTGRLSSLFPAGTADGMEDGAGAVARWHLLVDQDVAIAATYPSSAVVFSVDYDLQGRLARVNSKPSYYFCFTNVFSPQSVARALNDLRSANPALLITGNESMQLSQPTEYMEQRETTRWLEYPYTVPRKHDSSQIYVPFFTYIRQHYQQMPTNKAVWVNKDFSGASQVGLSSAP